MCVYEGKTTGWMESCEQCTLQQDDTQLSHCLYGLGLVNSVPYNKMTHN